MSIVKAESTRYTALLDACVLGGALRRNMLLSFAEAYLFNPKWSLRILDVTQKAFIEISKGENDGSQPQELGRIAPLGNMQGEIGNARSLRLGIMPFLSFPADRSHVA